MNNSSKIHVKGKQLACVFCGNDIFYTKEVKLNNRWLVFLNMELFSEVGRAYICTQCGYKHEFFD